MAKKMPGKKAARDQAMGMEREPRAKTSGGPSRGRRDEASQLTRGAPSARRSMQKSGAKTAGKAAGRKARANTRRRSQ